MAFTIGGLLEAVLLVVNAMAILQDYSPPLTGKPPPEDKKGVKRFLALRKQHSGRGWQRAVVVLFERGPPRVRAEAMSEKEGEGEKERERESHVCVSARSCLLYLLSLSLFPFYMYTHTHTHTHVYVYTDL